MSVGLVLPVRFPYVRDGIGCRILPTTRPRLPGVAEDPGVSKESDDSSASTERRCLICAIVFAQTALTTHLRRTHSIRLNPPHRPRYGNPGGLASIQAAGRYPFGMRAAGPAIVGPVGGDIVTSESATSTAPVAKPYCLPGYICQVCRFRSPTGAGLARHAYSLAQLRATACTQSLSSVVVREVATNTGGNMRPMLQTQELQHLSTTSASSQSLYSSDSIRVGVPLDSPILPSGEQHELQGQGQVQEHQPMTDAALDQTSSIDPINNEPCPDCGCATSGKCGQRTPEPGRILLVSQENLNDVTDPTRPQETFHLTALRVQQLSSTQENDLNEQSGGIEANIATNVGADQQEEALSAVKKSEVQIGDHSPNEMANDVASETCFNPQILKDNGDEATGQGSILQEQM
ncbi:hypothetical protein BIW11_03413 [Tropilaelaps mercedesae]|uniref:Uncharacterized protein n=1 Tax=Tropilaelaps mercedesae TaxID=418985 RepID=A0A1V9XLX0_9ACAR|nr:hypothetical protein BIW11_03413 [Tropilaelaps mercedesae]